MSRGKQQPNFGWVFYPENDFVPAHYSSPFALLVADGNERWDVWVLTPTLRAVTNAEEIQVESHLGNLARVSVAKRRAVEYVEKLRGLRVKGAAA